MWFAAIWKHEAFKKMTKVQLQSQPITQMWAFWNWTCAQPRNSYPFKQSPVKWDRTGKGTMLLKIPSCSANVYGLISCNEFPRTLRQKHVSNEEKLKLKWLSKYLKSFLQIKYIQSLLPSHGSKPTSAIVLGAKTYIKCHRIFKLTSME